jgi:hypothetical protein
MRRFMVGTLLLAAGVSILIAHSRPAGAARASTPSMFLDVGDSFQVTGAPLGCKVVARNGGKAIDCRVAGTLTDTYGTLMTGSHLMVVRFRNAHVAKIVFDARQRHDFTTCR